MLVTTQTKTAAQLYHHLWLQLVPLVIVVFMVILGATYFRSQARYFAEDV